jgi:hypothetical protein
MRYLVLWQALLIGAVVAVTAPPALAQKNEGIGLLGPRATTANPGSRVNRVRRGPPSDTTRRDGCQPANPSDEAKIDKLLCTNRTLRRKDERIARLTGELTRPLETAEQILTAHNAWLESRKPCAEKETDKAIVACLNPLYDTRLRDLEKLKGAEPTPEPSARRRK